VGVDKLICNVNGCFVTVCTQQLDLTCDGRYSTCRIAVASSLVPSPTKLFVVTAVSPLNFLEGNARVELSNNAENIPIKIVIQVKLCLRGCIRKFPDWQPEASTANGTAFCH